MDYVALWTLVPMTLAFVVASTLAGYWRREYCKAVKRERILQRDLRGMRLSYEGIREQDDNHSRLLTQATNRAEGEKRRADRLQARLDEAGPITVGDPDVDPIALEISFCGPKHVAVYARHLNCKGIKRSRWIEPNGHSGLAIWGVASLLLITHGDESSRADVQESIGLARASAVERITDAVRRYNQLFRQKGGKGVGAVKEEGRRDQDRQGHFVGRCGYSRRQGTAWCECAERGARASS